MRKDWDLINSLSQEELEIYHIINGIWIISREFRYKLTPSQLSSAIKLGNYPLTYSRKGGI